MGWGWGVQSYKLSGFARAITNILTACGSEPSGAATLHTELQEAA